MLLVNDDAEWTRIHGVMATQLVKFQQKGGKPGPYVLPCYVGQFAFQMRLGVVGDLGSRSVGVVKVCNESGTLADWIWTCRAHVEGRGPSLNLKTQSPPCEDFLDLLHA